MRVLITGAAGQLGQTLATHFADAGHEVVPHDRPALDITRGPQVRQALTTVKPDVVFNCSAYNDVDTAEANMAEAFAINADAVAILAAETERIGAALVHYSTDFVFDGTAISPYSEDDLPSPTNVYGRSKLAGEHHASQASRHYILRLASLFGRTSGGRSTIDWLVQCISDGRPATVFVDRVVSPSYAADVAVATQRLLENAVPAGIYHVVNSGLETWYGLAQEIAAQMQCPATLLRGRASEARQAATRPLFCALSNARLRSMGVPMPSWQSAIHRHLIATGFLSRHPSHARQADTAGRVAARSGAPVCSPQYRGRRAR